MVVLPTLMANSTTNMMFTAVAAFLFLISLAYAVSTITMEGKAFNYAPGTEGTTFIMETEIPKEIVFTGAEIVGSLYKLNFDDIHVTIDGMTINTSKEFSEKQQFIPSTANYVQTLTYDNKGNVISIAYSMK